MLLQDKIKKLLLERARFAAVVADLHKAGAEVLLVGGVVRDLLLGRPGKDIDCEVRGITAQQLEAILSEHGVIHFVGKQFGVYFVEGIAADWALPRQDSAGRHPTVTTSSELSITDAFRRRDLTINAMGYSLRSHELIDPFDGKRDLERRVLRAVDAQRFIEDPLRFYRVMQFVGRFECTCDQELMQLCATMDISAVARERIEQEFSKLFLQSRFPSLGIQWLQDVGRLQEIMPALYATIGCKQNPEYHPEGDVFEHSKQVLDCVRLLPACDAKERLLLLWAALCHDIGKPGTTRLSKGKLRSHGHAEEGAPIAQKLLRGFVLDKELRERIVTLIYYHMQPLVFSMGSARAAAYKRLAKKLEPCTMEQLAKLCLADRQGRIPFGKIRHKLDFTDDPTVMEFVVKAKEAGVWEKAEVPVLEGKDLLATIPPGPELGRLLKKAYEYQIKHGVRDKEKLKQYVLKGKK